MTWVDYWLSLHLMVDRHRCGAPPFAPERKTSVHSHWSQSWVSVSQILCGAWWWWWEPSAYDKSLGDGILYKCSRGGRWRMLEWKPAGWLRGERRRLCGSLEALQACWKLKSKVRLSVDLTSWFGAFHLLAKMPLNSEELSEKTVVLRCHSWFVAHWRRGALDLIGGAPPLALLRHFTPTWPRKARLKTVLRGSFSKRPPIISKCHSRFYVPLRRIKPSRHPHTEEALLAEPESSPWPSAWWLSARYLKWLQRRLSIIHASLPRSLWTKAFPSAQEARGRRSH